MKCSICGTESKADAKQCERCGASLVVPTFDKTMLLDVRAFRAAQQTGEAPVVRPVAPVAPVAKPVPVAPRRSNRAGVVIAMIALGCVGYLLYQLLSSFGFFSAVPVPRPSATPEAVRPAPGK